MSGLLDITGRVAIVTGSSSGNGRAIALALASEGAYVVCSDLSAEPRAGGYEKTLIATHEHIVQNKGKAVFQKADVSSEEEFQALVERAVNEYGRLDILVNNAGIFTGLKPIVDEAVEDFDKTMAVNARGCFLGMKHAIRQMMKQEPLASGKRGWIVNLASVAGQVGLAFEPSYCASKGAVIQLTKQVANDYAKEQIYVNAVCPGLIATAMVRPWLEDKGITDLMHAATPWPYFGTAEDVARAVLVLASDASSWTTGSVVQVDGGYIAR